MMLLLSFALALGPTAEVLPGRDVIPAVPRFTLPLRFLTWTWQGDGMLAVRDGKVVLANDAGVPSRELTCREAEGTTVVEGALAPGGGHAAALFSSGKVCLWSLGRAATALPWSARGVRQVAMGDDAWYLGYADGRVEARDLGTGTRRWVRNYRIGAIEDLKVSRDGSRLVFAGNRRGAAVVDPRSGRLLRAVGRTPTHAVGLDTDNKVLAVGATDGQVLLVDTETWQRLPDVDVGDGDVVGVEFDRSGELLAALTRTDAGLMGWVWSRELAAEIFREPLVAGELPPVFTFTHHGDQIAGDGGGGTLQIWWRPVHPWRPWAPSLLNPPLHRRIFEGDPYAEATPMSAPPPRARVQGGVALSPDGGQVLARRGDAWALRRGEQETPLPFSSGATEPRWSADGRRLLAVDPQGKLLLWEGTTGAGEARLAAPPVRSVDSVRGRILALGADGTLLRAAPGASTLTPVPGATDVTAFAGDLTKPERVAVGLASGSVKWLALGTNVKTSGGVGREYVLGTREVLALAFAPDGKSLAVVARRLGSAPTAVLTLLLEAGAEETEDPRPWTSLVLDHLPRRVEWVADGRFLLAFSPERVSIVDVVTGALLLDHPGPMQDARWVEGGLLLLDAAGAVRRIELPAVQPAWLPRGERGLSRLEGTRTAVIDGDVVELWQTEDGHRVGRLPPLGAEVSATAFDPIEKYLAVLMPDGDVEVYHTSKLEVYRRYTPGEVHPGGVPWVAFSPDAARVWASAGPRRFVAWDVETGKLVVEVEVPGSGPLRADTAELLERIVPVRDASGVVAAWLDLGEAAASSVFLSDRARRPLAAAADKALVAFAAGDEIVLSNPATGLPVILPIREEGLVPGVAAAFRRDGELLAVAWSDDVVRVYDAWGKELYAVETRVPSLRGRVGGSIVGLSFSVGGDLLYTLDDTGFLRRWIPPRNREEAAFPRPPQSIARVRGVGAVRVDAARGRLYTGHDDGVTRAWDLVSGRQLAIFVDHVAPVRLLEVSEDGRWLLSIADDDRVEVLDAASLIESSAVPCYGDRVLAAAISADGARFATLGASGVVRVWDRDRRVMLRRWQVRGAEGASLAFEGAQVRVLVDGQRLDLDPDTGAAASGAAAVETPSLPAVPGSGRDIVGGVIVDEDRWLEIGADGTLRYWSRSQAAMLAQVVAMTDGSWVVEAADGNRIASPSLRDKTAPPARINPMTGPPIH